MRGTGPGYRLVVKLDDNISGFGLRSDAAITRERRSLRARYQLIDEATGAQILDDTAGSTWMTVSPRSFACSTKRQAMGCASTMFEPMTGTTSELSISPCCMGAAPRHKDT